MQVRPEQSGALGPRRRQLMFGKRKRSYAWEGGRGCPQLGKPRQRGPGCRELSGNMSQLRVCDSGRLLEEFSAGCRHKAVANWRETGRLGWVGRGDEHRPCGVNQRTAVGREVRTPREATERGNWVVTHCSSLLNSDYQWHECQSAATLHNWAPVPPRAQVKTQKGWSLRELLRYLLVRFTDFFTKENWELLPISKTHL